MKYVLIAATSVLLIVSITGAVMWFFLMREPAAPSEPVQTPFGFVGSGSTVAPKTLSLTLRDGTIVQTQDFTAEGQPEWAGESSGYLVAGGEQEDFIVLYFAPDTLAGQGEFLVNVNTEPLGEVRRRAEAALKARLQMTESELCNLAVTVRTIPGLSDTHDGYDLGLSFCAGSVALP